VIAIAVASDSHLAALRIRKEAGVCYARRHRRKNPRRAGGRGRVKFVPKGAEKAAIIGRCTPDRKKTRKFNKIGKLALTAHRAYGKNR
jgi:hypothetical protein